MKKKIFITLFVILTCFLLGFGGWKSYKHWKTQQIILAQKKVWEEDCKKWLDGIAEVRVPAPVGGIYKALMNTSNCVLNETKKFTTKEQLDIYLKIIEDMKELEDYALYYKAGGNYPTDVEYYFLIILQIFNTSLYKHIGGSMMFFSNSQFIGYGFITSYCLSLISLFRIKL